MICWIKSITFRDVVSVLTGEYSSTYGRVLEMLTLGIKPEFRKKLHFFVYIGWYSENIYKFA